MFFTSELCPRAFIFLSSGLLGHFNASVPCVLLTPRLLAPHRRNSQRLHGSVFKCPGAISLYVPTHETNVCSKRSPPSLVNVPQGDPALRALCLRGRVLHAVLLLEIITCFFHIIPTHLQASHEMKFLAGAPPG